MRIATSVSVVLTLGLLAGCGGDANTISTPGQLKVSLATPNADDGAVLFTVSGASIDTADAAGYRTYFARLSPTSARIVVTGDVTGGLLVRIRVPDIGRASSYSAVVEQVASRPPSYALRGLTGYSISVSR